MNSIRKIIITLIIAAFIEQINSICIRRTTKTSESLQKIKITTTAATEIKTTKITTTTIITTTKPPNTIT